MPVPHRPTRRAEGEFPFCKDNGFCAILFDWDGVLVDSGENYYRAYEMLLRDVGILTTPREIYLREGQPTGQLLSAIFQQRGRAIDSATIEDMVERRREYDVALGQRRFFQGVWDLIGRLHGAHIRVGMVTGSSRKSIDRVLTTNLAAVFDAIITADDAVLPKPHAEPFLLAAERLAVEPGQCLVVENAPFGIRGARAAGCAVVALCTTLGPDDLHEANWIALNHAELEGLLSGKTVQAAHRAP
jgi:beta-phosphoglucomutase